MGNGADTRLHPRHLLGHEGFAYQGAGAPVARGVFVHQDAHFGWQVREHFQDLWRGIYRRAEEVRRGEAPGVVQDGAHVLIASDHPGREEWTKEDRRFSLRSRIQWVWIFQVWCFQRIERERPGCHSVPRMVRGFRMCGTTCTARPGAD